MTNKKHQALRSLIDDLGALGMVENNQFQWRLIPFGEVVNGKQLECAIRNDGAVQLGERNRQGQVGMSRGEAIELIKLLNKEFALDLLANLD